MTWSASLGVVSSVAISTMGLIISRTGVVFGSRPLRANLASTSRSVNIPATMPFSSITATAPTCLSIIAWTASSTVPSSGTVAGPSSHHLRRPMSFRAPFEEDVRLCFRAAGVKGALRACHTTIEMSLVPCWRKGRDSHDSMHGYRADDAKGANKLRFVARPRRLRKIGKLHEEASTGDAPRPALIAAGYQSAPIRCDPLLHESP